MKRLLILFSILFFVACKKEEVIATPPPNPDIAESLVESADDELWDELMYIVDTEAPSDPTLVDEWVDLSGSYELYDQALAADPSNPGANFGAAFTELLMVSQSNQMQETLDSWVDCLESLDLNFDLSVDDPIDSHNYTIDDCYSDSTDCRQSELVLHRLKPMLPVSESNFSSSNFIEILSYLPIVSPGGGMFIESSECPEIESLQDLLEETFLTRISAAIDRFDNVIGTGFEFIVTGEMMGDSDQQQITFDDTEFYLMKSALHMLRAVIYAVVTYDVNVPYYDFIDGEAEEFQVPVGYEWSFLEQNSAFLSIRPGQENSWPNAHDDLNSALLSIRNAWNFINQDTDTEFDIILLEDLDDADEVDSFLDEADALLNNNYNLALLDDEIEDITIDISGFLNSPPQNMKNIIPDYTVSSDTCENEIWHNDDVSDVIHWEIYSGYHTDPVYFYGNCSWDESQGLHVSAHAESSSSSFYSSNFEEVLSNYCQGIVDSMYADGNNLINFYIYINESVDSLGYINENYTVEDTINYSIEYYTDSIVGCPMLIWQAESCDEWKDAFDTTIGGLFPNMTPDTFFEGIEEEECEDIMSGEIDF